MPVILDIPRSTPSLNATHHAHWRVAYRQKKLWRQEIHYARLKARDVPEQPPKRARVTIERYGRRLDPDNFVGGLKSAIDCLRNEGLISDDTEAALELVPKQFPGKPRTIITIEAA